MDKELYRLIVETACDYQAKSLQSRKSTKQRFKENESSSHNTMRVLIDGIMIILTEKLQQPIVTRNENISYQISLIVSYIRTHYIITDHVMDGDLIEGVTLIRKQLESIARINELDKNSVASLNGKTPNIKNALDKEGSRLYGLLSEIAHFSTIDVGNKLKIFETGDKTGPSIYPTYHEDAFQLYGINTYLDLLFFSTVMNKLSEWYTDYNVDFLDSALGVIVKAAIENDIINIKQDGTIA